MIWVLLSLAAELVAANELVTCTSMIKLQNLQRGVRLHSHGVKYGSGSGQQSVTGQCFLSALPTRCVSFEVHLTPTLHLPVWG